VPRSDKSNTGAVSLRYENGGSGIGRDEDATFDILGGNSEIAAAGDKMDLPLAI
jgi:hypothetical protein